jgi:hypothetical protein
LFSEINDAPATNIVPYAPSFNAFAVIG